MENQNVMQITEFFSVCSQIVLESGNIIKEIFDPKGTLSKTKNGDEPFTEADVKVQTLIVKSLKTLWPNIKIIGEEEEVSEDLQFDFNSLKTDSVSKELFAGCTSTEVDLNKAIVWVDPLDGTIEFIKGALDCVTTLIGISIEGQAKIGVVGKYFVEQEEGKFEWQPRCYFANADYPHLYYVDYLNNSKIEELQPHIAGAPEDLLVCTTRNHFTPELQEKIDKINPTSVKRTGGAGNKVLAVIVGQAHCSFYPKPGMKRWDICAGEAILRAVGGVVSDADNKDIVYEEPREKWQCSRGVIATINKEKHQRVMEALLKKGNIELIPKL